MFADPTSITINAAAESFATISRNDSKSTYRTADGEFLLTISRTGNGTRNRHLVRIDREKIAANPVDSSNAEVSASVYVVMDVPEWGFTAAEVSDIVDGLASFLTEANVTKVIAGET